MDEMEVDKFSWSGLFLVTSICSFLFSLSLKLLDGQFSVWLLIIAGITGVFAILSWGIGVMDRQYARKKKQKRFAS